MRLLLLSMLMLLPACALIESDAGKARYQYTVTTPDGTVHEIDLQNAKNIGLISATVKYGDVTVELIEEGVDSSGPMSLMVQQNGRLLDRVLDVVNPLP